MLTLNLGILAHVDAGKTSLTERILFETGVISRPGRVDHGTTQTDTLELERQRGITIQSAVASFRVDGLAVNLIDTPGHTDFIAEVGRALHVLDAVVVVVSAVEGVQSQTRRLVGAVRASGLPLVLFVNKVDRGGARGEELVGEIERSLDVRALALSRVSHRGTPSVAVTPLDFEEPAFAGGVLDLLAERSEPLIARFLADGAAPDAQALQAELARQVREGDVVPVLFGSARTGAGVAQLLEALPWLLRPSGDGAGEPLSGTVFKVHRTGAGERIGLVRLHGGRVAVREQVPVRRPSVGGGPACQARITGLERFVPGGVETVSEARAGEIVRVHGLRDVRVGDVLGRARAGAHVAGFSPPTLESVIDPLDPCDRTRLNEALELLAEGDPLIGLRRSSRDGTISLRLYGEVQKEVVEATLRDEHGIAVRFAVSQTICIERVVGTGFAEAWMGKTSPVAASLALRVGPARPGSGIDYRRTLGALPPAFYRAIEETVHATLQEGLRGWNVPDCAVTVTGVGFDSVGSTAGDFRTLTPLVLMEALAHAGTQVCEPIERFTLRVPTDAVGEACALLATARATPQETTPTDRTSRIVGLIPSAEVHRFEQHLPAVGRGEAVFTSAHEGYEPVRGEAPARAAAAPRGRGSAGGRGFAPDPRG